MLTRTRLAGSSLAAAALMLSTLTVAPPAVAAGDAVCEFGACSVVGEAPGSPGGGAPGQGGQFGDKPGVVPINRNFCEVNNGVKVPYSCDVNYDHSRDCIWMNTAEQPPAPAGAPSPVGAWEECVPPNQLPFGSPPNPTRWMPSTVTAEGALTPSAAATQVVAQMELEGIEIGMVPRSVASDPHAMGAVGLPAWMWVKNPDNPRAWGPYTVTRTVDGVEVTATATPQYITWNMGDGQQVVCATGGTPYNERYGREESPSCGYTYDKTGQYDVTAVTTWAVEWSAGGDSGVIQTITRSSQPVVIGELQAVNVKPGG